MYKKVIILFLVLSQVFFSVPGLGLASTQARVRILMYHEIRNDVGNGEISNLCVKVSDFEKQMKFLKNNGFTPIDFNNLPKAYKYRKPVIVTFDDGYKSNYTKAFPILKKYKIKATIFVIGSDVNVKRGHANSKQLKEMSDSGLISLQNHTWTHSSMTTLSKDRIISEIKRCNDLLTKITGRTPYALCYPSGDYNLRVINVCKKYFKYCTTTHTGDYFTGTGTYDMHRIRVNRGDSFSTFVANVT